MAFYEHRYMHQTVEHCLKEPIPENVSVAATFKDQIVYNVDLPASVWAAVRMSRHDPWENELRTFESASLRQEWVDGWVLSRRMGFP